MTVEPVNGAAEAIMVAVKGSLPDDVAVYDTIVTGIAPSRYIVFYIPDELRVQGTILPVSDDLSATFQVTAVASHANPQYSAAMCRFLSRAVRTILTDAVIVPDDMQPAIIRHEGSQNPRPDEATPDKKVYSTAQFSYQSTRI